MSLKFGILLSNHLLQSFFRHIIIKFYVITATCDTFFVKEVFLTRNTKAFEWQTKLSFGFELNRTTTFRFILEYTVLLSSYDFLAFLQFLFLYHLLNILLFQCQIWFRVSNHYERNKTKKNFIGCWLLHKVQDAWCILEKGLTFNCPRERIACHKMRQSCNSNAEGHIIVIVITVQLNDNRFDEHNYTADIRWFNHLTHSETDWNALNGMFVYYRSFCLHLPHSTHFIYLHFFSYFSLNLHSITHFFLITKFNII